VDTATTLGAPDAVQRKLAAVVQFVSADPTILKSLQAAGGGRSIVPLLAPTHHPEASQTK
jgi:hypothetical protein